jgi:hypothetical protein
MKKTIYAATAVFLLGMVGSAQAATLSGTFDVKAVNITNAGVSQSQATKAQFDAALLTGVSDEFTYVGSLDFSTNLGNATTVNSWLATGVANSVGGSVQGSTRLWAPRRSARETSSPTRERRPRPSFSSP